MTVDDSLRAKLAAAKEERERQRLRDDGTTSGEPPGGGEMEARVAVLEQIAKDTTGKLGDVTTALDRLRTELATVGRDVAEMKGRVSTLPTTWAMVTAFVGIAIALVGGVLAAVHYGGHG